MALERVGLKEIGNLFRTVIPAKSMDGFMMPYRFCGEVELELMVDKYQRLNHKSKGLNVRYYKKLF